MDSIWIGIWTAVWLGILTSISPCPLATNIAAVSYIDKGLDRPRRMIASGLGYTAGRTLAYTILGGLAVAGVLSVPGVARFLQRYMNQLLGPLLILAGLILLELVRLPGRNGGPGAQAMDLSRRFGIGGAVLLGGLFALSFCPISAGLFFGSLIPLAATHRSAILLPACYGIGTGLPVVVFALLLGLGFRGIGRAFHQLQIFEGWARRVTGGIFVLVGGYYSWTYLVGL